MLAKKDKIILCNGFFVVLHCEAVTHPLKQIINDEKASQSRSLAKYVQQYNNTTHNQSVPDSVTHPRSSMT